MHEPVVRHHIATSAGWRTSRRVRAGEVGEPGQDPQPAGDVTVGQDEHRDDDPLVSNPRVPPRRHEGSRDSGAIAGDLMHLRRVTDVAPVSPKSCEQVAPSVVVFVPWRSREGGDRSPGVGEHLWTGDRERLARSEQLPHLGHLTVQHRRQSALDGLTRLRNAAVMLHRAPLHLGDTALDKDIRPSTGERAVRAVEIAVNDEVHDRFSLGLDGWRYFF